SLCSIIPPPPSVTLFPYTTLFRSTELERFLQDRSGKSIVDDGDKIVFFGKRNRVFQIHQTQRWICRRLDIQNLCVWCGESFDSFERSSNLADSDAHVGEKIAHQAIGAAVKLRRRNHFIALLQSSKERGRNGGHSTRSDYRSVRTFERGNFFFGYC